jgi:hypothetical protein
MLASIVVVGTFFLSPINDPDSGFCLAQKCGFNSKQFVLEACGLLGMKADKSCETFCIIL